jgi:hypothetical protein
MTSPLNLFLPSCCDFSLASFYSIFFFRVPFLLFPLAVSLSELEPECIPVPLWQKVAGSGLKVYCQIFTRNYYFKLKLAVNFYRCQSFTDIYLKFVSV